MQKQTSMRDYANAKNKTDARINYELMRQKLVEELWDNVKGKGWLSKLLHRLTKVPAG